jgi:hypothetical protein
MTTTPDTRAGLIDLATQLNAAREASNAMQATAPQRGVYGKIAEALEQTLTLITGDESQAAYAYAALLNGATVEQAIENETSNRGHLA